MFVVLIQLHYRATAFIDKRKEESVQSVCIQLKTSIVDNNFKNKLLLAFPCFFVYIFVSTGNDHIEIAQNGSK